MIYNIENCRHLLIALYMKYELSKRIQIPQTEEKLSKKKTNKKHIYIIMREIIFLEKNFWIIFKCTLKKKFAQEICFNKLFSKILLMKIEIEFFAILTRI